MSRFIKVVAPLTALALAIGAIHSADAQSVNAETNRPGSSTFKKDELVTLSFSVTGLTPKKASSLVVTVKDAFDVTVSSGSMIVTGNASGAATASYNAPSTHLGYYRVEATLPNGATLPGLGTRPSGFISYAVLPDPDSRRNWGDLLSRFGICGSTVGGSTGNLMQWLGARYLLDGPGWDKLEPNYAGQFANERASARASGTTYPWHAANNSAVYPTYAITVVMQKAEPTWAFIPGTGTKSWPTMGVLSAAGQTGFQSYTKARATAASQDFSKQTVRYYQITWEPEVPNGFGGTPAQLVEFYKAAHAGIHAADSKAVVMGPTMLPMDKTSLAPLYAAGLANYIDAVSVHPYAHFPPEVNALHTNLATQIKMAADAKGQPMPFISTEHGYASGAGSVFSTGGELNQALGNIRTSLIVLGEGFRTDFGFYIADYWGKSPTETANTFGYFWNLNPKIPFGTDKVGPKPSAPAYAAMTQLIDGSTSAGRVSQATGTQLGYRFKHGTDVVLALWDYGSANSVVSIPVPSGSPTPKICDWMGNCKSIAPTNGALRVHLLNGAPSYMLGTGI